MKRVLFVCEGNRARSQLAEALLRFHGGDRFEAYSAGIRPGDVLPDFTRRALDEVSVPADGLRPKHVDTFAGEEFDFLIVLCDTVRAEDPALPHARQRLDWPVEDPKDAQDHGLTIDQAMRESRTAVRRRIVRFLEEQGCIFCQILAGEAPGAFLYNDELVSAFMDIRPVNEGHALVIPRAHLVTIDEVPEETAGRMMSVAGRIAKALESAVTPDGPYGMEGYNIWIANGEAAGQEVFHVHAHVLPRFRGDGFGLRFPPGYGARPPRERLEELAAGIRNALG